VLKHVRVDTHHELCVMICILLSAFVGWYIGYKKMHGVSNIKYLRKT
jgi:hypothetical protein